MTTDWPDKRTPTTAPSHLITALACLCGAPITRPTVPGTREFATSAGWLRCSGARPRPGCDLAPERGSRFPSPTHGSISGPGWPRPDETAWWRVEGGQIGHRRRPHDRHSSTGRGLLTARPGSAWRGRPRANPHSSRSTRSARPPIHRGRRPTLPSLPSPHRLPFVSDRRYRLRPCRSLSEEGASITLDRHPPGDARAAGAAKRDSCSAVSVTRVVSLSHRRCPQDRASPSTPGTGCSGSGVGLTWSGGWRTGS